MGRLQRVLFVLVVLVVGLFPRVPARAAITELFLSEYIEGTSNNKALEIFNGTGVAVNLATEGYNIQMFFNGSATAGLTINLTGTVASGDVYVLAHSLAAPAILAQADQTNGAGWFNGDDAVVLRKGTAVVDVIGQIGFDPGTEWGSGLTSTMDNTLRRKTSIQGGDTNGGDAFDPSAEWDGFATDTFDGLGAHAIFTGADAAPSIASTVPANGSAGVAPNANITINFSEPVVATGSWFSISCAVSGSHAAAQSGGPQSFVLDPTADFSQGESCTVTTLGSQVTDQDADDPPDSMASNHTFSFTTQALEAQIYQIQGTSHISPLVGRQVRATGVVTARRTATGGRGFWMQNPDGNNATSDGIFVFTGSTTPNAQIGDAVSVSGTVSEFRPGGTGGVNNLTITQINSSNADVEILTSGNPVPAPLVLGVGGRMPPTENIDDDSATTRDIEVTNDYEPAEDAIDFYESLEGMLVRVNNGAVVNETESFGEITLLPDGGAWATGIRTPRGGILARAGYRDFNPERIIIDDEILRDQIVPRPARAMPLMNVGARIVGPIVGPLDYSFANYKIQATTTPVFTQSAIVREQAGPPREDELVVATFNVENLAFVNLQTKFDDLASLIVNNLRSPDLIGIEEVQDNNGTTDDGTVDASQTWVKLIAAIQAQGGPLYDYRQIDPLNNADGGAPGGNIRVGFLFRTDRGLSFIDRPGGTATTPTTVIAHPSGPQLSFSPGRIDPNNPAYLETRKSLAGEFRFRGKTVFAIVVHFSSKTDDQPLFGRFQPPTRFSEGPRHGQAQVVNDFVNQILAVDSNAFVIVLGDINDFEFSQTVRILEGKVLRTFVNTLPPNERYSYVFEGNSQVLDQILATAPVSRRLVRYDVVHVNSEFADQASDHEPSVARISIGGP